MEKIKAILLTKNIDDAKRVYDSDIVNKLSEEYDFCFKPMSKKDVLNNLNTTKKAEYLFSTWSMEHYTKEEIKKCFPNAKAIFYAAGSVQDFASEFLDCGIRVFSAFKANAVPVAEYTYAQIILATKGYFQSQKKCRFTRYLAFKYSNSCGGNYKAKIGIIGVGAIGSMVANKLKDNDVEVYYYDPFLSKEKADALGIKEMSLEDIFKNCDVITNHLANKDELTGVLNEKLFSSMKPFATFINTGRGRQVDEKGLCKALKKVKTRTALLDVTYPEPAKAFGKLHRRKNIFITPHIAGSNGKEVVRMAEYMLDDAKNVTNGEETKYEVTKQMLKNMA